MSFGARGLDADRLERAVCGRELIAALAREEREVHKEARLLSGVMRGAKAEIEGALHLRALADAARDSLDAREGERMARVEIKRAYHERKGGVSFSLE